MGSDEACVHIVCVQCVHACVCVFSVCVCVGHGYTVPQFQLKHTRLHTHCIGSCPRSREKLFFLSPLRLCKRREKSGRGGRKEAKGTRGGGIVFPPCVHYGWGTSTAFDQWLSDGLEVARWGYLRLCACVFVCLSVCDYDWERRVTGVTPVHTHR